MLIEITYLLAVCLMLGMAINKVPFSDIAEEMSVKMLFGVCVLPIVVIALGFLSLSTTIVVFIVSAILMLVFSDFSKNRTRKAPSSKNHVYVWVLSAILFMVFLNGAMTQSWLEDGDPNGYAESASYIARHSTFLKPSDMFVSRYMEPYAMGYTSIMGLLSSMYFDVNGVLKSVNMLLIALSILAVYYLSIRLGLSERTSLLCAFMICAIPSFSTRFIFAQSLGMIQMLMGFYFLARSDKDEKCGIYSGICFGSLVLSHHLTAFMTVFLSIIWIISDLAVNKRLTYKYLTVALVCIVIAGPWMLFEYNKYGIDKTIYQLNLEKLSKPTMGLSSETFELYTIKDLIDVPMANSTDNMRGFGIFIFSLAAISFVASFIYFDKSFGTLLIVLWAVFLMAAVFSNWLPISLIPTRMWPYASIPIAILAARTLDYIFNDNNEMTRIVGLVCIAGVLMFSMYPKFGFNEQIWGSSRLFTPGDYATFEYMAANTAVGEKAFDACMYERVWSMNLWDDPLDKEAILFKNKAVNTSVYGWDSEGWLKLSSYNDSRIFSENITFVSAFIRAKGYKYMLVNSRCVYNGVPEEIYKKRIGEFDSNPLFGILYKQDEERVYRILEPQGG